MARLDNAAGHPDEALNIAVVDTTGRDFLIFPLERLHHLLRADPVSAQCGRVELHADHALAAAGAVHGADAGHGLEASDDGLVSHVGDLAERALRALDGDGDDRAVVGVEVPNDWLIDVGWQLPPNPGDFRLHVLLCAPHIHTAV